LSTKIFDALMLRRQSLNLLCIWSILLTN